MSISQETFQVETKDISSEGMGRDVPLVFRFSVFGF